MVRRRKRTAGPRPPQACIWQCQQLAKCHLERETRDYTQARLPSARSKHASSNRAFLRPPAQVRAGSISSNDFKNGVYIEVDGAPFRILGAHRLALKAARFLNHTSKLTAAL